MERTPGPGGARCCPGRPIWSPRGRRASGATRTSCEAVWREAQGRSTCSSGCTSALSTSLLSLRGQPRGRVRPVSGGLPAGTSRAGPLSRAVLPLDLVVSHRGKPVSEPGQREAAEDRAGAGRPRGRSVCHRSGRASRSPRARSPVAGGNRAAATQATGGRHSCACTTSCRIGKSRRSWEARSARSRRTTFTPWATSGVCLGRKAGSLGDPCEHEGLLKTRYAR